MHCRVKSQPRALARLSALLLSVALMGLFSTCHRQAVDPNPAADGEPRLLSVRLSDIPAENIQIDHVGHRVVVTIPASLSATGVLPTLQLTPNTSIDYTNSSLYSNDKNLWVLDRQTLRLVSDRQKATTYEFVTKAAGNMAFGDYTGPREVTMDVDPSRLCFPLYNFRDSVACALVVLTNVATGRKREFAACPGSTCSGTRRTDGAVYLSLLVEHSFVDPGEYTVSVRKENGRLAVLDKTIQVRKGKLALSAPNNLSPVLLTGNSSFILSGYNLYGDSNLSLRLVSPSGESYPSRLEQAGTTHTAALFSMPAGIKPGYYYAQLLQDGEPTSAAVRVVVTDRADALFIRGISADEPTAPSRHLLTADVPFSTPITLRQGQTYTISTSIAEFVKATGSPIQALVRLASVRNPELQYTLRFDPERSQFYVSTGLPAGRYRLLFEQYQDNGVSTAMPLEREVIID